MKIDKANGVDISRLYNRQTVDRKAGERSRTDGPSAGDSVELSSQARELQVYRQKLAELPAAREEVVERLQTQIRDGTYQPDNRKIAHAMLREQEAMIKFDPDER